MFPTLFFFPQVKLADDMGHISSSQRRQHPNPHSHSKLGAAILQPQHHCIPVPHTHTELKEPCQQCHTVGRGPETTFLLLPSPNHLQGQIHRMRHSKGPGPRQEHHVQPHSS